MEVVKPKGIQLHNYIIITKFVGTSESEKRKSSVNAILVTSSKIPENASKLSEILVKIQALNSSQVY